MTWVPGKSHHIADALSRAPLFSPEETEDMYIDSARAYMTQVPAMEQELNLVLDSIDSDYVKFRHIVLNGTVFSPYSHQLKYVFGQLSIDNELVYLDAKRIVLPLKAVKEVLKMAHLPHAGITKTYELLCSLYFWSGMYNDVKQLISACGPCTRNATSLPKNLRSPMACVGVDLFDFGGKSHLVCVDRWSGYPLFSQLTSTSTEAIINTLKTRFNVLGWPPSYQVRWWPPVSWCIFGVLQKLPNHSQAIFSLQPPSLQTGRVGRQNCEEYASQVLGGGEEHAAGAVRLEKFA